MVIKLASGKQAYVFDQAVGKLVLVPHCALYTKQMQDRKINSRVSLGDIHAMLSSRILSKLKEF